jgi:hypothetical protein
MNDVREQLSFPMSSAELLQSPRKSTQGEQQEKKKTILDVLSPRRARRISTTKNVDSTMDAVREHLSLPLLSDELLPPNRPLLEEERKKSDMEDPAVESKGPVEVDSYIATPPESAPVPAPPSLSAPAPPSDPASAPRSRPSLTRQKSAPGGHFQSFRWKKNKHKSPRAANDQQLVADFFDVQSIASEPDFVGKGRLNRFGRARSQRSLETRSMQSHRSISSFASFFFRMRNIFNDEVRDVAPSLVSPDPEDFGVDDDEITLGSGFTNMNSSEFSVGDDDSESFSVSTTGSTSTTTTKKKKRRKRKKMKALLRKLLGRHRRTRTKKNQGYGKEESSEFLGSAEFTSAARTNPESPRSVLDVEEVQGGGKERRPPPRKSSDEDNKSVGSSSQDRWASDASSVCSDTMMPKRPSRVERQNSHEFAERKQEDFSEISDSSRYEDDEEETLSLLSGILEQWSEERDAPLQKPSRRGSKGKPMPPKTAKSILKTQESFSEQPKNVSFHQVEIREYERTVGDNPSCSRGPPISIGWTYVLSRKCALDEYETVIKPTKRSKKDFHLGADKRTFLLIRVWGCCEEEIRKARRECTYIQYCRAKSSFTSSKNSDREAIFLRKAKISAGRQQQLTNVNAPQKRATMADSPTLPRPVTQSPSAKKLEAPPTPPPRRREYVSPPCATSPVSSSRQRVMLEV